MKKIIIFTETFKTPIMKKVILIALITLVSLSCSEDNDPIFEPEVEKQKPSLKMVNEIGENYYAISKISLVGYEFKTLNIPKGSSQTFALDEGMPAGFENINVVVYYSSRHVGRSVSAKINFNEEGVTTITLSGQSGCEGCDGHSLKQS